MKTRCIIFALFLSTAALTQDFKKIDFAVALGSNTCIPYKRTIETMTSFPGHPVTNYKSGMGYFFEFLLSYNFNNQISISTGLNYVQNKLIIKDMIGPLESNGNLTNTYINLPLLFKYRFSKTLPVSIEIGPFISYLFAANETGTTTIDTTGLTTIDNDPIFITPYDYNNDVKENYKNIDFGLSTQISYDLFTGKKLNYMIFTRFNIGFTDIITNEINTNYTANVWKNYFLMFGIRIKFPS